MALSRYKYLLAAALLVGLALAGYLLLRAERGSSSDRPESPVASVKVATIERRPLELKRVFSGALRAESELIVAPKVGGRIQKLVVDLADSVTRGQTVALLDDAEYGQEVIQAEAELAVAMANLAQAKNALDISRREHQRIVTLRERGIASDSESDVAEANLLEKEAQVKVADAQVNRATAALESARIRFEYTRVTADWSEGDAERRVAERYVNEGDTVSANAPLLLIVQLDPIIAVISVTERDYARLQPGQQAEFATDAYPGQRFYGRIQRIAPVFQETSRQARIELALANPEGRLKPGMFIRATITLDRVDEALAMPESALTRRGDADGVFLVEEDGESVRWVPVEVGIRSDGWAELKAPVLTGRVVILGQHLIDDGSPIRIVAMADRGSGL